MNVPPQRLHLGKILQHLNTCRKNRAHKLHVVPQWIREERWWSWSRDLGGHMTGGWWELPRFFSVFCVNFPNYRHFMVENAFVKSVNFIAIKLHICLWKYLSSRLLVEYWHLFFFWNHCSDITWVPQINSNLMRCLTAGRVNNKEIPDLHVTDVCKGNLAVTDGFSHKVQEM